MRETCSPMSTVESVDKMVMTTAEANGHLDELMRQGTDATSDDSVCNQSPRITTGYYLSHTGYTVPSYSPIMHHRPVNIEYVPIHRSGSCQSCCCSSTQFCGQIPQAYAHPMAPCAPIVGGLCTYAASNNVDQNHPQHPPPPPTPIVYPSMVPSVFATPYSSGCCPHHGPFAASIQPIPFAGCSIDPSNISQQKSHGRVESPLVSTSETSSMSDASSKMGKVSENELTTKEDELTGNSGGAAPPPEESLPLSVESLHDSTQPISQRYVTGAKLEREHGRTPLFGDTPSWWNQHEEEEEEEVAKCQSDQGDPTVAQENDQPNPSLPRDEVVVLPPSQEKGEEALGQPDATANTYKASIRMDIPFAPVLTGKANHNNSKENCHSSESHRTAAFTIQFNEDHSTNMVAIEKESTRSYQRLHMARGKPPTTKMKVLKPKPVEEVAAKVSVNETVDDDTVSECGTYTVEEECSYAKNQQLYDVETAGDGGGADDRNALLKELIKISNGEKQRKVGVKQCVTTSKSGPSSPVARRTNSASQIVHATKGTVGSQTAAQNFRRSDGGRFSMRSKVTMSPGRNNIGGGWPKNCANKGQEVRPETLAWLRRKEYNPLKSAGAASTRGSTSSDTRILNKHERPVGKFKRESKYSNFSRSKSFHASTHRSSTPNRRQDNTTTKEKGAKSALSSPSSLRGQVFVQLGSLKRIQMLSVDLMTSASGLKEKVRDSVGQLDDVEEDGNEATSSTPNTECPCPLSDVIKKLTVVDKTLKVTHRMVNQMLSHSKSATVGNESTV